MIEIKYFNFEGYTNLFSYLFENKIYVIHGDFGNKIRESILKKNKNLGGKFIVDEKQYDDFDACKVNNIFYVNKECNVIKNTSIYKTARLLTSSKLSREKLNEILVMNSLDSIKLKQITYEQNLMLGLIIASFSGKRVFFVEVEESRDNQFLVDFINFNSFCKKFVIIISVVASKIQGDNVVILKYFQGYLSNKLNEE